MQKPKSIRSKLLMCHYYSYSVISEYVLNIEIPKHQSTDMRGTIKFAQNILPSVEKIFVFSDDALTSSRHDHLVLHRNLSVERFAIEGWLSSCHASFALSRSG
jgi:hypothetical protein